MIIAIGFFIGALLGLTGAGGSIFAVPLLMILLGLKPTEAMGIALGAVSASALLGALAQRKHVLWLPALLLAVSGAIFAPVGKYISLIINDHVLIYGFTAIALIIAIRMLHQSMIKPEWSQHIRAHIPEHISMQQATTCRLSPTGQFQLKPRCLSGLVIGGSMIGLASGMFGVGGGFLIVPLLLFLSAIPMPIAVATSLAIITLVSGSGFIAHIVLSDLNTEYLVETLIGASIGMLITQRFSKYIAGPRLQQIFAVLLIFVSLIFLIKNIFN